MKIWTSLKNYAPGPNRPLILALGNFDGVHLGHQKILNSVVAHAKKRGGEAAVLTFAEHPQRILHHSQEPALLTSPQHRLLLFREMGIESCFLIPFTLEFSQTSAEEFVRRLLVEGLEAREIHLGYNAHFGFRREGDSSLMRKLSEKLGFEFFEAEPVKVRGQFISSTLLREMIRRGELETVKEFLGRPFGIFASVVRGKGRGKSLGFPTANLQPHSEILPPLGVYPVEVRQNTFHLQSEGKGRGFLYVEGGKSQWFEGILNHGVRPTFENAAAQAIPEAFLFGFNGNLYGKQVEVRFHARLREEKAFRDREELSRAIKKDVEAAREYFKRAKLG